MAFIDEERIVPNFKNTFGELRFQRLKYRDYEKDATGEDDESKVKSCHIDLDSSAQRGEVAVVVDGDIKDFKYGDKVDLVDPHIQSYAIVQDTNGFNVNSGFSIKVEKIIKASSQAQPSKGSSGKTNGKTL